MYSSDYKVDGLEDKNDNFGKVEEVLINVHKTLGIRKNGRVTLTLFKVYG